MKYIFFILFLFPFILGAQEDLYDDILPRTSLEVQQQFYELLKKVDTVLQIKNISYWLTSGSLLGAIRHEGMIPWDDDVDLACFVEDLGKILSLREEFASRGLTLLVMRHYIKIFPEDGIFIEKQKEGIYPWKFPFVDIFLMEKEEDRVVHASVRLKEGFPHDWFYKEELLPLKKSVFGPLNVPIPNKSAPFLFRMYGEDCFEYAYAEYDHAHEKKIDRVKVKIRKLL